VEQAAAGLEKIVIGSLRRASQGEAPLLAWPLVCGSAVAQRTRAVDFSDAILRVAAMNRYAGQKVEKIEFVISTEKAGVIR
jgi:hypothetical protein